MEFKGLDKTYIKREIAKNNIYKIVNLSKINLAVTLLIATLNFIAHALGVDETKLFSNIPIIMIALFNIACIVIVRFYKLSYSEPIVKHVENAVFFYISLSLFGSAFVMIIEQNYFNTALLYTLIVFVSATFFVIKLYLFVMPVIGSGIMVIISMMLKGELQTTITMQIVYFVVLTIIAAILSNTYNQFFIRNLKIKAELLAENQYRKQISKELREANRKLLIQNSLDPLTGLQNRMSFNNHIETLKQITSNNPLTVTAMMVDIDCFKNYNDFYGHSKGDQVIAKVGGVILEVSDKYGVFAARYGGEEFTLLMHSQSEQKVKLICEEIIRGVAKLRIPHEVSDVDHIVTVSIGAKVIEATTAKHILQAIDLADSLLYEVKRSGKNAYLFS